jgi:hypothetical protein
MRGRGTYHLVANRLSVDTVEALQVLLARAKSGRVQGIAYVVMYQGREYTAGAAGECRKNPTFTRGMLSYLDEELGVLVRER